MKKNSLLAALLISAALLHAQPEKKYTSVPDGYLVVLRQGDTLFTELERLAIKESLPSASFSGIGFADVEFGFFNASAQKYKSKMIRKLEIASLDGSIAWQNGKPSIHAHGVGGDSRFRAYAGHILSLVVSTGSLEVLVTVHDKKLQRIKDEKLGANVLQVQQGGAKSP